MMMSAMKTRGVVARETRGNDVPVNIFVGELRSVKHVVPAGTLILERSRKHLNSQRFQPFRPACCCFSSSATA